jgi:hypothetical protein
MFVCQNDLDMQRSHHGRPVIGMVSTEFFAVVLFFLGLIYATPAVNPATSNHSRHGVAVKATPDPGHIAIPNAPVDPPITPEGDPPAIPDGDLPPAEPPTPQPDLPDEPLPDSGATSH